MVSCCGTCNTMKWRRTPADFLRHCAAVARFSAGAGLADSDSAGDVVAPAGQARVDRWCTESQARRGSPKRMY